VEYLDQLLLLGRLKHFGMDLHSCLKQFLPSCSWLLIFFIHGGGKTTLLQLKCRIKKTGLLNSNWLYWYFLKSHNY